MLFTFASIVLVRRGQWGPQPTPARRREVFAWAAGAGFQGVEISPRWLDFHGLDRAALAEIQSEVADAGLRVSGLNLNRAILTRTDRAPEHGERLARAVEVAADWEAPTVTVSLSMPTLPDAGRPALRGSDVPREEYTRSAEFLARLARRAAGLGVSLSLELHDDGLLDTAWACLDLLRMVGEPNVGVHPDLGNVCRGPGPPPDWEAALRVLAPYANAWSVKNYRSGNPVPLEEGDIDHGRAVRIMRDAGFRGWVGIEAYFGEDPLGLQRRSLAYLQRLVREAG